MFQALLITFREGLESFLIVGIIVAYLRKTDRGALVRSVLVGLGVSAVLSVLGAWAWLRALQNGADFNNALYEGIGALVAAVLVGVMLWQVNRLGRRLKANIESRIDRAAGAAGQPPTLGAKFAVAAVTIVFVTREMAEALFILAARAMNGAVSGLVIGSVLGLGAAGGYAWLWSRHGQKLRLHVVLRATAIFLALFLVQLLLWGVHELAESGVIHGSQGFHDATERLGPEGDIGTVFALIVGSVPLIVVAFSVAQMLASRRRPPDLKAAE